MDETEDEPTHRPDPTPHAKPQRPKWIGWVRDLSIFAIVIFAITWFQTSDHVRDAAPQFDLAVLDSDARVSSAQLLGKPTLIYFWAPWCGVCEVSSSNVSSVRDAVGDDYNVVSMVLDFASEDDVRDFMQRTESDHPVLLGDRAQSRQWAVTSFPTIYILDEEGAVSSSVVGYTTTLGMRARLWWAAL